MTVFVSNGLMEFLSHEHLRWNYNVQFPISFLFIIAAWSSRCSPAAIRYPVYCGLHCSSVHWRGLPSPVPYGSTWTISCTECCSPNGPLSSTPVLCHCTRWSTAWSWGNTTQSIVGHLKSKPVSGKDSTFCFCHKRMALICRTIEHVSNKTRHKYFPFRNVMFEDLCQFCAHRFIWMRSFHLLHFF